tara:strand:- start:4604 stop:5002 length:399 start_codon:yes stop_codon:yes gene_type:complete
MYKCLFYIFILSGFNLFSQTQLENGEWEDKYLSFKISQESIRENGSINLCISKDSICIENLIVGFTVRLIDFKGVQISNSLWTGKNMEIEFKKAFPEAIEILVEAGAPFVINKITGTRISTGKPLSLRKYLK